MEYNTIFSKRAKSYEYATTKYQNSLKAEFETAVQMCDLSDNDKLVNIPGACVDLNPYINVNIGFYLPFETCPAFANLFGIPVCSLSKILLPSNYVNRVVSLTSLHHTTNDERLEFYKEVKRILVSDGKLIIGDVRRNSNQDRWLNEFVNKYNSNGHLGRFWDDSDIALLNECGFSATTEIKKYAWKFDNQSDMIDCIKNLFGLDLASDKQILDGLVEFLDVDLDLCNINWELIYFIAKVNQTPALVHH